MKQKELRVSTVCNFRHKIETKEFNKDSVNKFIHKYAKLAYNKWCDRGISLANHVRTMGVLYLIMVFVWNM